MALTDSQPGLQAKMKGEVEKSCGGSVGGFLSRFFLKVLALHFAFSQARVG